MESYYCLDFKIQAVNRREATCQFSSSMCTKLRKSRPFSNKILKQMINIAKD